MLTRIANEVYIDAASVLHITEDVSNNAVVTWMNPDSIALTVTGVTAQEVIAAIMEGDT